MNGNGFFCLSDRRLAVASRGEIFHLFLPVHYDRHLKLPFDSQVVTLIVYRRKFCVGVLTYLESIGNQQLLLVLVLAIDLSSSRALVSIKNWLFYAASIILIFSTAPIRFYSTLECMKRTASGYSPLIGLRL